MRTRNVLVVLLVAGCAGSLVPQPRPFVGKFIDHNETFSGEVRVLSQERGLVIARTSETKLYCEGFIQVTRPVFRCLRGGGILVLQCGGGRRLTGDWGVTGCLTAAGTGLDNTGARFSFIWGPEGDETETQAYLAQARAEVAGKPSLDQPSRGGSGTGFLISADGLIVTNHHVIDGANTIEVYQGNTIYRASIVAQDAANDVAILKTDMKGRPLSLASARASMRGDEVLTLGYPLSTLAGESQKATFGRINATVGLRDDARYLQIDVPIQPGNSGGPLLNKRGEVIGIVSASLDDGETFAKTGAVPQVVNYAVKSDYILVLVPAGAQLPSGSQQPELEFDTLVGLAENSVVRIVSKP